MATLKSLQDIGAVQLATQICNIPDVKKEILIQPGSVIYPINKKNEVTRKEFRKCWIGALKKKAAIEAEKFCLPIESKEKSLSFVVRIGIRILNWARYHEKNFDLSQSYISKFLNISHFHSNGFIDQGKVAEDLLKDEEMDMKQRYKIACFYCHIDGIASLYRQLSQEDRNDFYDAENPNKIRQIELVKFWSYYFEGKIDKLKRNQDLNVYGLVKAIKSGSIRAVEYFWEKLDARTKHEIVVNTGRNTVFFQSRTYDIDLRSPSERFENIFFFFFSQMENNQKIDFFRNYTTNAKCSKILRGFLDWPYQDYFMETIRLIWTTLTMADYLNLLVEISKIIQFQNNTIHFRKGDENTYNYGKLLKEFWFESPNGYKRYALSGKTPFHMLFVCLDFQENHTITEVMFNLFTSPNITSEVNQVIASIFYIATNEERENILCDSGKKICSNLAEREKWKTLDGFLIKCLSCEEKRYEFKRNFIISQGDSVCASFIKSGNYAAAESFMKWTTLSKVEIIQLKGKMRRSDHVKHALADLVLLQRKEALANKFLEWLIFLKQKNASFKREIFLNCQMQTFATLVNENRIEFIQKFIEWCGVNSADVAQLKKKLSSEMGMEIYKYLSSKYRWAEFERFTAWCFPSVEEIVEFKKKCARLEPRITHPDSIEKIDRSVPGRPCRYFGFSAEQLERLEEELLSDITIRLPKSI